MCVLLEDQTVVNAGRVVNNLSYIQSGMVCEVVSSPNLPRKQWALIRWLGDRHS